MVARYWHAIAQHEPPSFAVDFLGNRREQSAGFIIREMQQSYLLLSIQPDDEPRRPTAELSVFPVKQHWPGE